MTTNPRWFAFWLALGLVAAGGETVALILNGAQDSLSAQVWMIVDLSPWVRYTALAGFGVLFAWLATHFFGRRG